MIPGTKNIERRTRRLERRGAPRMYSDEFTDEQGRPCILWGRIGPDGERLPGVLLPQEQPLDEWMKANQAFVDSKKPNGDDDVDPDDDGVDPGTSNGGNGKCHVQ